MSAADVNTDDDFLEDAKEAHAAAVEAFADNYKDALDDVRFARLGEQWPEGIQKDRMQENRPCLTINRLPSFIRQVVNDARQNKPAITVHPVDSGADPETAEVFNGLIRHIEQSSDADVAYDTSLESAVTGGFGWFTINTRYATDDGFEQDLVIDQVANPFAITPDPSSTAADSSDWNVAFHADAMTKEAFGDRWDGADPVSFDSEKGVGKTPVKDGELVFTVAMWTREQSMREIMALSPMDPQAMLSASPEAAYQAMQLMGERMVVDVSVYEANKELFDACGVQPLGQTRKVPSHKVMQRILSGADVLEKVNWAGKFIPIVPVYGEDLNIEGKRHLAGLVRPAKDPQRMFNYWRTTTTELVALAPKTPFIGKTGAFDTDAAKWATANTATHAYIEYDGDLPPQRQAFAGPPTGALQEALNASDDMKSIMGLHDASLGARSNETSGVAIMARQREGDVSSFHFIDNLSRSIRHAGRILIDLIPQVYSTPRMIRILGPEGDAKAVKIGPRDATSPGPVQGQTPGQPANQPAPEGQETGKDEIKELEKVYDLTVGKYDLVVSAGPSFTTRREEAAQQMIELIRAYPQAAPLIGDLLAKNLDWPGADEIATRLHKLLPAQLQDDSPEGQAAKAQIMQLAQALGQARAEIQSLKTDQSIEEGKLEVDQFNAKTNRLKVEVGPKGMPYDAASVAPMVVQSVLHILQSPDLIEAAQNGADPQALTAALLARMQGQQSGQTAPPQAA